MIGLSAPAGKQGLVPGLDKHAGPRSMHVLITGATGYVGGCLAPRVLKAGHEVRVLVRESRRLASLPWAGQVEVVQGDLLDPSSLTGVFDGIEAAYYLVHSMCSGKDFAQRDGQSAENFCRAGARLRHAIYVGGLLPRSPRVSRHLQSRAEVGRILANHLPTTELRAGPIIGSGSASFEMLRYLTERVPLMIAPRWILNHVQPAAVEDVLSYLLLALERRPCGVVEIGGDLLTYKEMMLIYARLRRLRRLIFAVPPLLPPSVGAGWMGIVARIPSSVVVPLVESMMEPLQSNAERARKLFPEVRTTSCRSAMEAALRPIEGDAVEARWNGTWPRTPACEHRDAKGLICETRTMRVPAPPSSVFRVVSGLGGERGWLASNWVWRLRGLIDRAVGGPGLRRGRRDPHELLAGDAVDSWRVEKIVSPNLLRLRAELRLPGRAWLQWEAVEEEGCTRLTQTAAFAPHGLFGVLYWYLLYPLRKRILAGMIQAIGRRAIDA